LNFKDNPVYTNRKNLFIKNNNSEEFLGKEENDNANKSKIFQKDSLFRKKNSHDNTKNDKNIKDSEKVNTEESKEKADKEKKNKV